MKIKLDNSKTKLLPYCIPWSKETLIKDVVQPKDINWKINEDRLQNIYIYYGPVLAFIKSTLQRCDAMITSAFNSFTHNGLFSKEAWHAVIAFRLYSRDAKDKQTYTKWYPIATSRFRKSLTIGFGEYLMVKCPIFMD